MKKYSMTNVLSLVLCAVLIAAMALTGCGNAEPAENTVASTEATAAPAAEGDVIVLGEGAVVLNFVYEDLDGKETHYEIHTDKETVGEALLENELVEGTVGDWGLMIDTVNGLKLDYEKDGMYWAFFVDGEYAQTGVDATEIVADSVYSLVPTEG